MSGANTLAGGTFTAIRAELTKRERFAMAAMQGLCANGDPRGNADSIAMLAVHIADATIAKLERTERKEDRT